jgi:glycosyltransferase involved in cell wall biosynthesis
LETLTDNEPRLGREPWILIAGGFHRRGGMDKANLALAQYLVARSTRVHLVGYEVDADLACRPGVTVHLVPKPARSFMLGQHLLRRKGREVAAQVSAAAPRARVVANGGNCEWSDINWVHSVHHAWASFDHGAPLWFKGKSRLSKMIARRQERTALSRACIVIANSARTRRDLIENFSLRPETVRTVYLGTDSGLGPTSPESRAAARTRLGRDENRHLAAFVGALGHDGNKGLDTLLAAWQKLRLRSEWNVDLIIAGGGRALPAWQARIAQAGMADCVTVLGHTNRVQEVLAAADLLVSPVRYEAYGLNVHEAICCEVPAIVSRCAGVAERYPTELTPLLLEDPQDVEALMATMLAWRASAGIWKERVKPFARELRRRTWDEMAGELVAVAEESAPRADCCTTILGHGS